MYFPEWDKEYAAKCPKCGSTKLARHTENETGDPATIKLFCTECLTDFFDLRDSITLGLPVLTHLWRS